MTIYDEIEIDDLDFDSQQSVFFYNCPCGDRFRITLQQLLSGEVIAECPSCSLQIRVVYRPSDLEVFRLRQSIVV